MKNLVCRAIPAALAALLAVAGTARAQPEFLGFSETRLSLFSDVTGDRWQMVERFRPTFQASPWERTTLVVTVEAHLTQGRDTADEFKRIIQRSALGPVLEQAGCEWPDRGHRVFRVREAGDYLEVDRLYLDFYREGYDLRIGRQSLHWGSGQFFNPSDPFPEVLLAEPWRPRSGVNAARATIPFGAMNDVTAVAAIDDGLEYASGAARARVNFAGVDVAFSGGGRGDTRRTQVGLDLRGTTVVGWWVEGALFPGPDAHTEVAVGVDYSFPVLERLVVMGQYYRSGSGAAKPDDYTRILPVETESLPKCDTALPEPDGTVPADTSPFRRFTLARDYFLAGATSNINPDLAANAFVLQNLNDGTALFLPTVSYLATAHLELSVSAVVPFQLWGKGGEFRPRPGDLRYESRTGDADEPVTVDFKGLSPSATVIFWGRLNF